MAGKFWTTGKIAIAIVALILLIFLVFLPVGAYNSFVTKSQDVNAKWSEVENQYQRQADLIPNLVAVVSSYAGFEAGLLTNLTNLRSQWQASLSSDLVQRDQTGVEMTSALARGVGMPIDFPSCGSVTTVWPLEISKHECPCHRIFTKSLPLRQATR
jgi:LemA protein